MATTKKIIVDVRSNTNLNVRYEDMTLTPQIELVLLTQEPVYDVNKQSKIVKSVKIGEFRCITSLEGLNEMISSLQKTASDLQIFQQMAGSLNKVIEQYKKPEEK